MPNKSTSLFLLFAALPLFTQAQDSFPSRPLRIVVPYAPAGTPDLIARILAEKLSARLGQAIVVENKPGASGAISAQAVKQAPADGYTLWIADNGQLSINPNLQDNLSYAPLEDFIAVSQLVSQPFFIYAQSSLGVTSLRQFVALAEKQPGKINYGSVGNGSPHHLCMAMFERQAGLQLTHIPYKSAAQLIPSMMANDISAVCTSPVSATQMVNAHKALPLAIASPRQASNAPEIPTVQEALGSTGLAIGASIGVLVKAGTPSDIVQRLSQEIRLSMKDEEFAKRLQDLGMEIIASTPEQYETTLREDLLRYREMVRVSGAVAN